MLAPRSSRHIRTMPSRESLLLAMSPRRSSNDPLRSSDGLSRCHLGQCDQGSRRASLRTISFRVTAATVVAPARVDLAGALVDDFDVQVSCAKRTRSPSASISTFARIGIVLRRSTTDWACATAFEQACAFDADFMLPMLRVAVRLSPRTETTAFTRLKPYLSTVVDCCGWFKPYSSSARRSISRSSAIWLSVVFSSSTRLTPCMTVV